MKDSDTLSQWSQAGLWSREIDSPGDRCACSISEVTGLVADVCVNFARVLGWKSCAWPEKNLERFVLTENVPADQETSQIELVVSPAEDRLRVLGSFSDTYQRRLIVSDQYVHLSWADRQGLGQMLTETLVKLRRQKGAYGGSDSSLAWL